MFFKRLLTPGAGNNNGENGDDKSPNQPESRPHLGSSSSSPSLPVGVQLMNPDLQKKLSAKAIQYNMKVVIRGDRNVGKTSLFRRIQGQDFVDDYVATDEIKVAHITWSYKTSDDIVKIEVWDVVDKGKPRQKLEGLKLSNQEKQLYSNASLDAEFIDVYKGAHCVIFVFDITKLWTMEYVEREIIRVPAHLPILIMANRADQSHHRVVPRDRPRVVADGLSASRPAGGSPVMACEASMRNNFGLRFVHAFLGVPFLVMQRQTLAVLMERNATELEAMNDELQSMLDDPSLSYDAFSDTMANRRRENADRLSPAVAAATSAAPTGATPFGAPQSQPNSVSPVGAGLMSPQVKPQTAGQGPMPHGTTAATPSPGPPSQPVVTLTGVGRGQPIVVPPGACSPFASSSANNKGLATSTTEPPRKVSPEPLPPATTPASSSSLFSRVFRQNTAPEVETTATPKGPSPKLAATSLGSVDDFVPVASDNVDSFLADEPLEPPVQQPKKSGFMSVFSSSKQTAPPPKAPAAKQPPPPVVNNPAPQMRPVVVDSDEEDGGRPQIAGFSEDIDEDDFQPSSVAASAVYHRSSSSSGNDDDFAVTPPPVKNAAQTSVNRPVSFSAVSESRSPLASRTSSIIQPPSPPPMRTPSFTQPPSPPSVRSSTSSFAHPPPTPPSASRSASILEPPMPPPQELPSPESSQMSLPVIQQASPTSSQRSSSLFQEPVIPSNHASIEARDSDRVSEVDSTNHDNHSQNEPSNEAGQAIWNDYDEPENAVAEEQAVVETPAVQLNTFTDLDFDFLASASSKHSPVPEPVEEPALASSAKAKKETTKKTKTKKSTPIKKGTKKVAASAVEEETVVSVRKSSTASRGEPQQPEKVAKPVSVNRVNSPAALKTATTPGTKDQRNSSIKHAPAPAAPSPSVNSHMVDDEDDLESFLNS